MCVLQVTGELSTEPPERLCDIRGGFFCDEPGLGKTVTALSLILKTQVRPACPPWVHETSRVSCCWCHRALVQGLLCLDTAA